MDYERKYNELLARVKSVASVFSDVTKFSFESVFPEIIENKDERIRKEMYRFIKTNFPSKKDWISWLEKQTTNNK